MKEVLLETKDLCKEYMLGKVKLRVLKNINLKIYKESFVVILGQSGSGKSTLLNMISALDTPSSGEVFFDGENISTLSHDKLADIRGKRVGFVFQQFNLFRQLTALENVALPAGFQGMTETERLEKASEILTTLGLGERLNHKPTELSGGEQQRVAISRSLINNPDIIVADEPTGNVDSKTGEIILDILQNLHKKENRTIIVVTHDRSIADLADEVINIKDGEIVK